MLHQALTVTRQHTEQPEMPVEDLRELSLALLLGLCEHSGKILSGRAVLKHKTVNVK